MILCPITELGFIRISSNKKALALPMEDVRKGLARFMSDCDAEIIPDDLHALETHAANSDQVTDSYLAELASRHGLKFATLDTGITHPAVELIV